MPSPPLAEAKAVRVADLVLLALFLGLTFLLGVFPLNDTDFWWHLRTGDWIRETGRVPRTDLYTFGASDHRWIDLHWGFQVALSCLNQWGGIDAINIAKCVVTTLAVGMLITAKRREWPVLVMLLVWLPALLLLSGRMYVRPETVTLLYMAIDIAVLFRIDRHPRLVWIIPLVQLFWVNTQGLFVFGPILLGMGVIDAALRPGAFAKDRFAWWKTVLAASLATGLACLINPYGIYGALFPIQLLDTMSNPAFANIAELQPLLDFIGRAGFRNLPLQIHLVTLVLGGMSFVLPIVWRVFDRFTHPLIDEELARKSKRKKKKVAEKTGPLWRLSPFRLMLFVTFSLLSFKATRNSHQFAAVVGTVTAWNFGEWAAALQFRRAQAMKTARPLIPRIAMMVVIASVIGIVGSGKFYAWTGEGRTVGLGERPIWYPHEAVKFAGSEGMPRRFLTFHNGHAGLFEYHNGPKQQVFADARLEVIGPQVAGADNQLGSAISSNQPGWSERVTAMDSQPPGILIDHIQEYMAPYAATILASPQWRCVWYDPIASVYLNKSSPFPGKTVDFAARHFGLEPSAEPRGRDELLQMGRTIRSQLSTLVARDHRVDLAAPLILLGSNYARRAVELNPRDFEGWKLLGQMQFYRLKQAERIDAPFDVLQDLQGPIYALEQAALRKPTDVGTLTTLMFAYLQMGLNEEGAKAADRLLKIALTPDQERQIKPYLMQIAKIQLEMNAKPQTHFENMSELNQVVAQLLEKGRAASAADVLEHGYKQPQERSWEMADRIATLRLRLGELEAARQAWASATNVPRPALQESRIAATYLLANDFDMARQHYRKALAIDPNLFEALFGLATLENDVGHASKAVGFAIAAEKAAGSDAAKVAARSIADFARPYAEAKKSPAAAP